MTRSADGDRTTGVRFVDFGNSESVNNSCIKIIPKSLLSTAPIAVLCTAVEEPLLSMSSDDIFNTYGGKELTLAFSGFEEPYEIRLLSQDGKTE